MVSRLARLSGATQSEQMARPFASDTSSPTASKGARQSRCPAAGATPPAASASAAPSTVSTLRRSVRSASRHETRGVRHVRRVAGRRMHPRRGDARGDLEVVCQSIDARAPGCRGPRSIARRLPGTGSAIHSPAAPSRWTTGSRWTSARDNTTENLGAQPARAPRWDLL